MRNLLALLALLVLVAGGVGYYRGWFSFHKEASSPGHTNVKIDIDTSKIGKDLHQSEQKIQHFLDNAGKDKNGAPKGSTSSRTDSSVGGGEAQSAIPVPYLPNPLESPSDDPRSDRTLYGPAGKRLP